MGKNVNRAVCVSGDDITATLTAIKTIRLLEGEPDAAQSWMASTWFEWRANDVDMKDVMDGIGLFFDLYYMKHGDFAAMEQQVLEMVPDGMRVAAVATATELAAKNVASVRLSGGKCCNIAVSRVGGVAAMSLPDALPN